MVVEFSIKQIIIFLFHLLVHSIQFFLANNIFVMQIICAGKDLATEETATKIINLLRQLQQTLPPAVFASTWSSLQPQHQLALQSVFSS